MYLSEYAGLKSAAGSAQPKIRVRNALGSADEVAAAAPVSLHRGVLSLGDSGEFKLTTGLYGNCGEPSVVFEVDPLKTFELVLRAPLSDPLTV